MKCSIASTDTRRGSTRRGHRQHHRLRLGVVVLDQQHVAADLAQVALVDARGAHPEAIGVLSHRHVAVREPADAVRQLDPAQVVGTDDLIQRKRCRAAGRGCRADCPASCSCAVNSSPSHSSGSRSVSKPVVDHQPRRRQRLEPVEQRLDPLVEVAGIGHRVVALLRRHEVARRRRAQPAWRCSQAHARAPGTRCAARRRAGCRDGAPPRHTSNAVAAETAWACRG